MYPLQSVRSAFLLSMSAHRAAHLEARPVSFGNTAAEYVSRIVRCVGVERITLGIEALQLLRRVETVLDRIARHQAAGALRMKADDLEAAALPVFEHRRDHRRFEQLRLDRLEVLARSAVDQHPCRARVL